MLSCSPPVQKLVSVRLARASRCILPRMESLALLLPLQVFLLRIFGIRPKCITEGENIIKLDTRRFTLA